MEGDDRPRPESDSRAKGEAREGGIEDARGLWRGQVELSDDFDELPPDIAEAFGA